MNGLIEFACLLIGMIGIGVILFKTPSGLAILVGWGQYPLRDVIIRIIAGGVFMAVGLAVSFAVSYYFV